MTDPQALARQEELQAMDIAADAMIAFAGRHAAKARQLAAREKNAVRKRELLRIAAVCDRVPAHAPRDFHEALQHYWFIHLGVISEANPWDAFNPGRLDQHLLPFYRRGLADGSLTREKARELLQAFWMKFNNHPSPPKVGVTAEESGTYTDFALINTGGVDPEGEDGVNEVSFLILEVIEEMRLLQPSSMVQVSRKNPDAFLHRALKIVRSRLRPALAFQFRGAWWQKCCARASRWPTPAAAAPAGCVETGAFGREGLHPDRLLQPGQGAGDHPEQRPRSAQQQTDRPGNGRPEKIHGLRRPAGRLREATAPFHRHQGARQQHHRPPLRPRPAGPLPVAAHRRLHRRAARTTTTAAPATTPPISRAWAWERSPTP